MQKIQERRRLFVTEVSNLHFRGLEIDGQPLTFEQVDKEAPYRIFSGSKLRFRQIFMSELTKGREAAHFNEVLSSGDNQKVREFFFKRSLDCLFRGSAICVKTRSESGEKKRKAELEKFDFYSSLGLMSGLISIQEFLEFFSIFRRAEENRTLITQDSKYSFISQEMHSLYHREPQRDSFSTPEQVSERTDRIKSDVFNKKYGKEITTCLYLGSFRPYTFVHSIIATGLKGIADRVIWAVTSDEAYRRLARGAMKERRGFTAADALKAITSTPMFNSDDDIVKTERLVSPDGVDEAAEELWSFGDYQYVYAGSQSEPLYTKRVQAATIAGKKTISGVEFHFHAADMQRLHEEYFRVFLSAQNPTRERMLKQYPDLSKWMTWIHTRKYFPEAFDH